MSLNLKLHTEYGGWAHRNHSVFVSYCTNTIFLEFIHAKIKEFDTVEPKDSESVEEVVDEDEEEERQEDSVEISSNSDSEDNIPLLELEKRNEGKK